jgi:hypothetical protein
VEVQLIMKQLDATSILRLARCSRALFRCASNPFVWKMAAVLVKVRGSDVIEYPRRACSLLRFAPSKAFIGKKPGASAAALDVSCATLLRVPDLAQVKFVEHSTRPLMRLDE